ncbi:MAG: hypothetical protein O6948_10625 [Deltaproteobacteria bacterium]|jgi:hypothetical protein|nr:hypothetical protein [Deltaproteobacteria bacterium]
MFDYRAAAQRAGIADEDVARLCQVVRDEFPDDEMMFELHVLRAVLAIESGQITLEQALKSNAGGG